MPNFSFLEIGVIIAIIVVTTALVCYLPWAIADLVNTVKKHL